MAYNFEYPYVDPERYNADWLLNITKETRKMMEQLMQDWETYKTALNAEWAAYQTNLNNQWTTWKAQTLTDLNAWKAQTLTDLNAWKAQTQAGLDAWRATMESEWSQFQGQITGEVTTLKQQFALLQAEMSTFKTDITNQVNSYAQTIAQQNAAIAAMQETVDNFNGQIPGLVQNYLDTLTPTWTVLNNRTIYRGLAPFIGRKVRIDPLAVGAITPSSQSRIQMLLSSIGVTIVTDDTADFVILMGTNSNLTVVAQSVAETLIAHYRDLNYYVIMEWPYANPQFNTILGSLYAMATGLYDQRAACIAGGNPGEAMFTNVDALSNGFLNEVRVEYSQGEANCDVLGNILLARFFYPENNSLSPSQTLEKISAIFNNSMVYYERIINVQSDVSVRFYHGIGPVVQVELNSGTQNVINDFEIEMVY